jgi:hypothetical protein
MSPLHYRGAMESGGGATSCVTNLELNLRTILLDQHDLGTYFSAILTEVAHPRMP